jgi:hypothetical protein
MRSAGGCAGCRARSGDCRDTGARHNHAPCNRRGPHRTWHSNGAWAQVLVRPAGTQLTEPSGSVGGRRRRGDMHGCPDGRSQITHLAILLPQIHRGRVSSRSRGRFPSVAGRHHLPYIGTHPHIRSSHRECNSRLQQPESRLARLRQVLLKLAEISRVRILISDLPPLLSSNSTPPIPLTKSVSRGLTDLLGFSGDPLSGACRLGFAGGRRFLMTRRPRSSNHLIAAEMLGSETEIGNLQSFSQSHSDRFGPGCEELT